ncbi:MAG: 50S ribosomal protein L24, partial [Fidelibacterota bacterium]
GRVLKVFPGRNKAIVEGINFIKRHTKPSQQNPQGGIIEKEAPIHISNLAVLCNKCNTPIRVKRRLLDDGTKVRICSECGEIIE